MLSPCWRVANCCCAWAAESPKRARMVSTNVRFIFFFAGYCPSARRVLKWLIKCYNKKSRELISLFHWRLWTAQIANKNVHGAVNVSLFFAIWWKLSRFPVANEKRIRFNYVFISLFCYFIMCFLFLCIYDVYRCCSFMLFCRICKDGLRFGMSSVTTSQTASGTIL